MKGSLQAAGDLNSGDSVSGVKSQGQKLDAVYACQVVVPSHARRAQPPAAHLELSTVRRYRHVRGRHNCDAQLSRSGINWRMIVKVDTTLMTGFIKFYIENNVRPLQTEIDNREYF